MEVLPESCMMTVSLSVGMLAFVVMVTLACFPSSAVLTPPEVTALVESAVGAESIVSQLGAFPLPLLFRYCPAVPSVLGWRRVGLFFIKSSADVSV